ncbi:hypothetical protein QE404_003370 [Chryseobacterium camelliae]|uniref:Uncharacterized protein n=1 Tax=Chryseobacterium camelliae TaxID=1265445 RepID=A0ABU0TPM9_9FLAO|nr:hypothetical protein [Chryseobacterium camelliae]
MLQEHWSMPMMTSPLPSWEKHWENQKLNGANITGVPRISGR